MIEAIISLFTAVIQIIFTILGITTAPPEDDGKVNISFDFLNGNAVYSYDIDEGSLIEEPETPKRRGLVFDGWYHDGVKWNFETDSVTEDIQLTAKWIFGETFFENDPNAEPKYEGSNLRIMSFNVLASDWNNKPPVNGRDTYFFDVIGRYKPEVIGLQEFNAEWYDTLEKNLITYKIVNADNNKIDGKVNYSTIAYNPEAVTLIEYNQRPCLSGDNDYCRNITWALFEKKDTNQRFIVTSTHWALTSDKRYYEAVELAAFVKILESKYKVPIFSTGDYNSNEDSEEYSAFMRLSNYNDAKFTSENKGLVCSTYHLGDGTGSKDDYASGYWKLGAASFRQNHINTVKSIDHIFASKNAKILYYDTVVDKSALEVSDHCAIFIDAAI